MMDDEEDFKFSSSNPPNDYTKFLVQTNKRVKRPKPLSSKTKLYRQRLVNVGKIFMTFDSQDRKDKIRKLYTSTEDVPYKVSLPISYKMLNTIRDLLENKNFSQWNTNSDVLVETLSKHQKFYRFLFVFEFSSEFERNNQMVKGMLADALNNIFAHVFKSAIEEEGVEFAASLIITDDISKYKDSKNYLKKNASSLN